MQIADTASADRRHRASGRDGLGSRFAAALFGVSVAVSAWASAAAAQEGGIVGPGSAVVTGFSGFLTNETPDGEDPFDYVTVNPEGSAAVVVDLSSVGDQGQLSDALKTFVVPAAQTGQVFGVALDNAPQPNIYLAATSAYGLSIYLPDGSGTVKRIRSGTVGAQFVPGQFGPPEYGGSPGSVWRVDGASGEVILFAQIDAAAQGVAALGGLAFDPGSQQLFVADRSTGIIHRFGLDGVERGTYDHGVEGRPPAGLSALPYVPGAPVDINSPAFDTENPATWGFAAPARRVFGLAVRNSRLYYSIAQGPQVWSVAIAPNGAVGGSPRLEVDVPALQDGIEIASIAFDGSGRMYLAERGATVGDYELTNLAYGGAARVLRYVPKAAGDPTPGNWRLEPDQYAIGLPAPYNNANGGVALGYGYQPGGTINYNACRATLWSTGERLLDPGDPSVPPDTFPAVDGLQGNAPSLVEPQNMPPLAAWFIDYNDQPGSPDYRGYMGAIAIYSPCAGQGTYVPPPPPPPVITCPPGTVLVDGQCVVTVVCPPGTSYRNGTCVYDTCPPGYVRYKGQCVPPPLSCPPGLAFYEGKCVPLNCPPGMKRMPNGQCICPVNNLYYDGQCIPPQACPPGMVKYPNGVCWCPAGTHFQNGQCVPNLVFCPPGFLPIKGKCVPEVCPPGYIKDFNGFCVPIVVPCNPLQILLNGKCVPKVCPANQILGQDGKCHPVFVPCKPNEVNINGQCVPKKCPPLQQLGPDGQCHPKFIIDCKQGFKPVNGKCVPINPCKPFEKFVNGKCVPFVIQPQPVICGPNQVLKNGVCVPKPIVCGPNQVFKNGQCVPLIIQPQPIVCGPNQVLKNGVCVPKPIVCGPNQVFKNGQCVPLIIQPQPIVCGPNQVLKNGQCVPLVIQPKPVVCGPNQVLQNGQCVPKPPQCGPNQVLQDGVCVAKPAPEGPKCSPGFALFNGKCMPKCKPNEVQNPNTGQCKPKPPECGPNQVLKNGKCVAKGGNNGGGGGGNNGGNNNGGGGGGDASGANDAGANAPKCSKGFELFNGKCMPKCKPNEVQNPNTGQCKKPKKASLDDALPALDPTALVTRPAALAAIALAPVTRRPGLAS